LLTQRKMSLAMFPRRKTVGCGWMIKYLFLTNRKPRVQLRAEVTYWFLFFGLGIMVITGFILWFPFKRPTPFWRHRTGGQVGAQHRATPGIFVVIWHLYVC
jgi:cytochrome b subunit of formate dehydrogenase